MTEQVAFEQTVRDGRVRGTLSLPETSKDAAPAVLLCEGIEPLRDSTEALWDTMTEALLAVGIALARVQPRCNELIQDDYHAYSAQDHLADLTIALDWLAEQRTVNESHLGALGYGIGGGTVACLAAQSKRIARLGLINAAFIGKRPTQQAKSDGIATTNGSHPAPPRERDDHEPPREYLDTLADLAPLDAIRDCDRPILLLHGAADRVIDPENLLQAEHAAIDHSAAVEPYLLSRTDHEFSDEEMRTLCIDRVQRFFMRLHPTDKTRKRR